MAADVHVFCLLFYFASYTLQGSCYNVSLAEVDVIIATGSNIRRDASGSLIFIANVNNNVLFVGRNFSKTTEIAFTLTSGSKGDHCEDFGGLTVAVSVQHQNLSETKAYFTYHIASPPKDNHFYYICVKQQQQQETSWIHQGEDSLLRFSVEIPVVIETLLPLWVQCAIIGFLLCLSGLFSGLNLGLMALDKTELKIIARCGSESEKKYARVIAPLRKRGNFLLCTLLLGNVLVNNSLTILLDNVSNGMIAIIGATVFIVIFGEIIPQALCSRHGLSVGAKTRYITYLFMCLTFPISFPISLLLDKILGEEIGQVYNREKLQELIRLTKDTLYDDEVNIISGALTFTKKTVIDIMTRIEDVFMLEYNENLLNFETMATIMKRGYTRIPVYETDKSNIVALLNIKDLALIDPDDNTPLKTVCKFYQHPLIFVFDDHRLDEMLQDFRQGHSHLAIVRRVNNEGDGDPYYETLGVVTLEDVIEEIIQSEIIDETDTLSDNIRKAPRMMPRQDFSAFQQNDDQHLLSPQLTLATFQFLSTSVDVFQDKFISETILKKLIKQNISIEIHPERDESKYIYKEGVPCDYFVLILEGHVEVAIGKEKLVFQGGPFTYYGVQALNVNPNILAPNSSSESIYVKQEPYIPDFSMKASDNLLFLRVRRPHYIVAYRATLMGRSKHITLKEEEAFTKEWKKVSAITNATNNSIGLGLDCTEQGGMGDQPSKPVVADINWTPLPSSASLQAMIKRSDSRDSGWSVPASDQRVDTSESEQEVSKLDMSKTSTEDGNEIPPEGSYKDRTSSEVVNDRHSVTFSDSNDEEGVLGECMPLVSRHDPRTNSVTDDL